ncbi:MAG: OmpA family protein [Spirochaetales bacterium]|uniref:OmpA family protein n=1 Tax=Candidatus Thalassospirochaeta sargassi TaxID=3119039 RepID=A0AAJ1MLT0_9SPIO|nr:OmpA family protein [Spirochaetales bacterium]
MRSNHLNIKTRVLVAAFLLAAVILVAVILIARSISADKLALRSPVRVMHNPKVTWAVPDAEVCKTSSGDWTEIGPGQRLVAGSSIKTGHYGNVDISFDEGTLIRVAEDTIAKIDDISLVNVKLSLDEGRLITKFRKITGREIHKVSTPDVVCGIRGTELIVEVGESDTMVYGMSGITEVASVQYPEQPVLLGFQQKSRIIDGNTPESPEDMTDEEIAYFRRQLDSMHDSEVFFIATDLKFKPDSAEFEAGSEEVLEGLAKIIKRKRLELEIAGHTADVGDRASQYDLSRKRAITVMEALIGLGVKEKRLRTIGYGGSKPIADNESAEGRAMNRRVEFIIKDY